MDELSTCLYRDAKRFRAQLRRLRKLDMGIVVVEGHANARSLPAAFVAEVARLEVKYGVHIQFCCDRTHAQMFSVAWLKAAVAKVKARDLKGG